MIFDKKISNIVKLIAIFFMLSHHLFSNNPYHLTANINYFPLSEGIVFAISTMGRICINFFVFISGYGLYKSYIDLDPISIKANFYFVIKRVINLLMQFWPFYFLTYLIKAIISGSIFLYGTSLVSLKYFIFDFFGVSFLFGTPLLNDTWWYLSFALIFILIFPLLAKVCKKNLLLLLIAVLLLLKVNIFTSYIKDYYLMFLFTGIIGISFARFDLYDKMIGLKGSNIKKNILATILLLFIFIGRGFNLFERTINSYIVVIVVFFLIEFFSKESYLKNFLSNLGENSTGIYYLHYIFCSTFLYYFIIIPRNFVFILLFLFIICLVLTKIVKKIELIARYDILSNKVIRALRLK